MSKMDLFFGDHRENETNWLETLTHTSRECNWDENKTIKFFGLSMAMLYPAGDWWEDNYKDTDASWNEIETAFLTKWPQTTMAHTLPTPATMREMICEKAEKQEGRRNVTTPPSQ
jgi:hypothetical protein